MKKTIAMTAAFLLSFSAMSIMTSAAETGSVSVYVTISDNNAKLQAVQEEIEVTDVDNDGVLTIDDALYLAHEKLYDGGAEAGYKSSMGNWGKVLNKLWGIENGGAFAYYVNGKSAMGMDDELKDGDYLDAYAYIDTIGWSDSYSFFNSRKVYTRPGTAADLKLSRMGYDANYIAYEMAVGDAVITVNGEYTDILTDEAGNFSFTADEIGKYVISAYSEDHIIVPPASVAEIDDYTISKGVSLTLDGNIGLNFYADLGDDIEKVVLEGPAGDIVFEGTDLDTYKQSDGIYKFTYEVNACQAASKITLKVYDQDGAQDKIIKSDYAFDVFDDIEYSVNDYIADSEKYSSDETLSDLVIALDNYCKAADNYFNGAENQLHHKRIVTDDEYEYYKPTLCGNKLALVLNSRTAVRVFYDGDADKAILRNNGKTLYKKEGGIFDIPNISADKLMDLYVLEIDGESMMFSPVSYCYLANGTDDAKLKDIGKSLMIYGDAAFKYKKENK